MDNGSHVSDYQRKTLQYKKGREGGGVKTARMNPVILVCNQRYQYELIVFNIDTDKEL